MRQHAGLIKPRGRVLDVAAGSGRNASWLATQGFMIEAVDRDEAALQSMHGVSGIHTRIADMDAGAWLYQGQRFDAIIVCRYLYRPLFPALTESLEPGGVLIYETFMQGHEAYGRPQNPAFLLKPDELLQTFIPPLRLAAFEQGYFEPENAVLQRICAIKSHD